MNEVGEAQPANEVRGEISVELGDPAREFVLRPDYAALCAIEQACGRGLLRLALESGEGNLTLDHAATIVAECIKAQGRAIGDKLMALYSADKLGPMMIDAPTGFAGVQGRICTMLTLAASGGYNASGEIKAVKAATA